MRYTGQPRPGVILRILWSSSQLVRWSIWSCSQCRVSIASSMDGPMNRSAQSRHNPSSTLLPSTRTRRQSADRAPWATISCRATDLPLPGSPPMSMFRSARVTSTRLPSSSVPRWTGFQIDSGATGMLGLAAITVGLRHVLGQAEAGDEQQQGPAAVGAHRPAAGGAGLGGGERLDGGQGFQVGDALVAQPGLGRGGDVGGATPDARPGGADHVHVSGSFRELWIGGAGCPGFRLPEAPRVFSGRDDLADQGQGPVLERLGPD